MSFLEEKSKVIEHLKSLFNKIHVKISHPIVRIRSDRENEFDNVDVNLFCKSKGIKHEFSAPRTPQHNGVAKRKKRVSQEMARVIHMHNTPIQFWVEVINTTCYTTNKIFLRLGTKKTFYELWTRKKPNLKYFRTFGNECYMLRDGENLGKFDAKSNVGIFLGYSTMSKAYGVYNDIGYDQDKIENQILTQESIEDNPKDLEVTKENPNDIP